MKTKTHPKYPGYLFYDDGRIQNVNERNPHYKKFLKLQIFENRVTVFITLHKKAANIRLDKITAELFVPNPEKKKFVIHKDGNARNIHYTNLEWSDNNMSVKQIISQWEKKLENYGKGI